MKGFDRQFILRWMLEQGQCPRVIPNGSKVMCIALSALSIRITDSINFLPKPLSKLPKTFGLEELAKENFSYLFNCPANQSYVGSFPSSDLFTPSTMSTGDRENFFPWSDVDILRRCCKIFREEFQSVTGVDPFP
ncbi:DNA_pol_B_2 domain-containing protein [Nephila pilipes]|uniref:DNA_pol_B_2 domain-containing protein n=1 Tax=Nephila pilipes TaxID=299642 RepID=A0A8X6U9I4_NEPPI|nr:DNA_pol_B_2 domain-containing protein [Nephila pilipes]